MELTRICADPKCRKKFKPTVEWQECCCVSHANRVRVRRHRARQRGGDGGGPGGKQPMLFSRSEMHRRKPAKAVEPKPKQDGLFLGPDDEGIGQFAGVVISYGDDGKVDGVSVIRPSAKLPSQSEKREAPVAA